VNLFDLIPPPEPKVPWMPAPPPSLDGIDEIELDGETTGLRWWETDRPVGWSVGFWTGDRYHKQYLPFGHRGAGAANLSEEAVKEWMRREVRGKRITNANTRFDVHMAREWGVDLEAQGNEVSDVQHYAALLDDHRKTFSQAALVRDFLPNSGEAKVTEVGGYTLDMSRVADYHPGTIAARAEADVWQVYQLRKAMWPLLDAEGLQRVRALEDKIIYVVCECEKNGALIDEEALDAMIKQADKEIGQLLMELYRETGIKVNPTGNNRSLTELFYKYKLPDVGSYTDEILKAFSHVPAIAKTRRVRMIMSIKSKYLMKYKNARDSRGILRYALHQLRSQKDEHQGGGEAGTVSGRFSSTALIEDVGANIQQVMKTAKQRVKFGYDEDDDSHDHEIYPVRQLHVPAPGTRFCSSDAAQIEYRIFGSYTRAERIINAYKEKPDLSFHKMIHALLREFSSEITYRRTKDLNFAQIYGAGLPKTAYMMGFITEAQLAEIQSQADWRQRNNHPLLESAKAIKAIYDRELPEAADLLKKAKTLAEGRGYVCTLLGRRVRFPLMTRRDGSGTFRDRTHKALNGIVQGGAADINKQKLVELHEARKDTGFLMRFTVHDEVDGDVHDDESAQKVHEILNRQSFPELSIPILWETGTGANWRECA
jgi:DNA polymerase I-like protein with 3'-5' exonuclease and polymerase domains